MILYSRTKHLQHELLPVLLALREVHARHAALADAAQDPIARRDDADLARGLPDQADLDALRHAQALDGARGRGGFEHRLLERHREFHGRDVGLAEVVRRAGLDRLHRHVLAARLGQHQRRRYPALEAELAQPGEAVHARTGRVVEQHGVVAAPVEADRGLALCHRVPARQLGVGHCAREPARDLVAELGGVVDDEDAHRGRALAGRRGRETRSGARSGLPDVRGLLGRATNADIIAREGGGPHRGERAKV
jgi:hypothetical protein